MNNEHYTGRKLGKMQRKGCEKIWGKCRKYKLQGKWTGQKCTTAETAPIVRIWCRPQATSFSQAATRPSFLASRCLSLQRFLTQYSGSFLQSQVDIWPAVWWDRMEGSKHWWPPLTAFRWTPQRNESESAVKNQMLLCSVLKEVVRWRPLQVSSSRSVGAGLHDAPALGEDLEGAVADGCSGLTSEIFWK